MSVDPCEDFYEFACGGWMKLHPVPPSESHRNQFDLVMEKVDFELKGMEKAEKKLSTYLFLLLLCSAGKYESSLLSLEVRICCWCLANEFLCAVWKYFHTASTHLGQG
jgi:hypothetical protein